MIDDECLRITVGGDGESLSGDDYVAWAFEERDGYGSGSVSAKFNGRKEEERTGYRVALAVCGRPS